MLVRITFEGSHTVVDGILHASGKEPQAEAGSSGNSMLRVISICTKSAHQVTGKMVSMSIVSAQ